MFKNYLKIFMRNFQKYKGYSFINISGLTIGMTCTLLIFLWVQNELSFDRYHENSHRIYRINKKSHTGIWAFNIINALAFKEFRGYEFNEELNKIETVEDLLFIPNISYKIEEYDPNYSD